MTIQKIKLPFRTKKAVLALGSQTKNTVCFAEGDFAYLSRVHADLSNPEDFLQFEKDVKYFLKKNPRTIAVDLHPEYQSTKFALKLSPAAYRLSPVQHHHAHIASCMAENGLKNQEVIGVAFDGTGLGVDDKIWGAEFLVCDYKKFIRAAHLKEIPLVGGERAVSEPWRLAAVWLYLIYKDAFLKLGTSFIKGMNKKRWGILKKLYSTGFNSPLASSMGRLFDAAASLIFAKYTVRREAELAIELESIASSYKQKAPGYKFKIIKEQNAYILDPAPVFKGLIHDLKSGAGKEKIAYRFHRTAAEMIRAACLLIHKKTKIKKVVLSGGVFQNNLLLRLALDLLYKEGFCVFTQKKLSCNDSAVSLGQVAVASYSGS